MNPSLAAQAPASTATQWHAALALTLAANDRGTRLLRNEHVGPLCVQKPFYPEGPELAHVYLLHPPGGLVSGDSLEFDLQLSADSGALFTTPGAARLYRARGDARLQRQRVALTLDDGASGEWLPLENIFFPGTNAELSTRVTLAESSRFLGWEINCLGLPAGDLAFTHGRVRQRIEVYRAGRPIFLEHFRVDGEDVEFCRSRVGLAGHCVSAVLLATPIENAGQRDALLEALRRIEVSADALVGCTAIGELMVVRYLGDCSQQARRFFERCWEILRPPLLGRQACAPRIWST